MVIRAAAAAVMLLLGAPLSDAAGGEDAAPPELQLGRFAPKADGVGDDTQAFQRCFAAAAAGGTIIIPPGDYALGGGAPIPLSSTTTVIAQGARFHLPERLGDGARLVLFSGTDIHDFAWRGGEFIGHCFDHRRPPNTWEPNVNTRIIVITTTSGGSTRRLSFRDLRASRIAGSVIHVAGLGKNGDERAVDTWASDIAVQDCVLEDSGKFMWDYGLLWQILVWPEDYQPADVAMARRYFRNDLVRPGVAMADGDDRVRFDNREHPIPVSRDASPQQALCFYGGPLPRNLVRGRRYFVVESGPDSIKVAEQPHGVPLRFAGASGEGAALIHDLHSAFYGLYQPTGSGPGKGGVDIVCARTVLISGCTLSALGDTMHLQRCDGTVFTGNHIVGSRMGAFFLAEFCRNSTVTGNLVDGTNGSRVMSVEKSNENVTITGNVFRGGGRGSWINQPKNLILQGNIFIDNTTKGERDPWRGRRSFETGDYERFPELYFTLYEPNGSYGPVIVRDNLFVTGPEARAAMSFARGGHDLLVAGNVVQGGSRELLVEDGCERVEIGGNPGVERRAPAPDPAR
jgi:hypothetical protein